MVLAGCGDDHAGPGMKTDEHGHGAHESGSDAEIADAFKELSAADRALAKAQGTCPVSDEPLGSMGTPVKATHGGKTIFLCCEGCQKKFHKNPETYFAKVEKQAK
jgi:Cu(I)/Ag(I) efflux system membrane fusion protein